MMNSRTIILLAMVLASPAWAQSAPQTPAAKPAAPPARKTAPPQKPVHPAAGGQRKAAPVARHSAAPHKGAGNSDEIETAIRHALKKKKQKPGVTGAAGPKLTGQRDPFVSPIVERAHVGTPACSGSGRQCLAVGDVSLHGVVETEGRLLAVVVNGDHTYFLREHDPLADGEVVRITRDSIVMHERLTDELGRPITREITKKIGAPAV